MHIFDRIQFDEPTHTYTLDGQPLTSVSRTLDRVKPKFDAAAMAPRTAARTGQSVEEVLAEWEAKKVAGQQRGERVHKHIQSVLLGHYDPTDPFLALNELPPEETAFNRFWTGPTRQLLTLEKCEWIVGDAELGIAGRLDALFHSSHTDKLHIWDWKSGKFRFESDYRKKLLPPFGDLDDCEFKLYSLQASLYRLIVERGLGVELGECYILHMDARGVGVFYQADDYRERLLAWLTS